MSALTGTYAGALAQAPSISALTSYLIVDKQRAWRSCVEYVCLLG
jgi:hypothetical protein